MCIRCKSEKPNYFDFLLEDYNLFKQSNVFKCKLCKRTFYVHHKFNIVFVLLFIIVWSFIITSPCIADFNGYIVALKILITLVLLLILEFFKWAFAKFTPYDENIL